jgi:7-cyano-7-deazaguanine tRNA-ribosyltransferase
MPVSFEVRETDLMGRLGVLRTGSASVETPCLVPVVHPVLHDIPLSKYRELGFGAVMTNSLIAYRRRREEALEKGLHRMLGFDGIVMTDSGGYQVLRYGQVDMTPLLIAEFQSEIGSDFAVTLDRPTGYSLSRKYAAETMSVSLIAARETIEKFGSSRTTWVGPIQGGLFDDLVVRSTKGLLRSGFEMLALGSPVEMMDNYRFSELVKMIVAAKKAMPFSVPMHLFGAGHPLTLPLSVALGCDTFDSASYILFAKKGRYMTERGTLVLEQMSYLPCSCPVCNSTSRSDLLLMERDERVKKLALHNLYILRQDVLRCREAISEGRLWDLVEERASTHPRAASAFLELAKSARWLGIGTRFLKDRGLLLRSAADELRPELEAAKAHLDPIMKKRGARAVLLTEDAERPLQKSPSYGRAGGARTKPGDVYKLHPFLGPYPSELEFVYPFSQTVTDRAPGREEVRRAVARLRGMGYSSVAVLGKGSGARGKTKSR